VGKRVRSALVAGIAGIVVLSACSGATTHAGRPTPPAAHTSSASARGNATFATTVRRQPSPATTTPTTTTSATAATPEFSFDDSVPPPRLVNTGTDYAAILESLVKYGNWLGAHRPNPALTSAIVARGTRLYDLYIQDLTRLRDNGTRGFETLGGPSKFTILSTRPDAFSAKVVEDIRSQRTVVAGGKVTGEIRFTEPTTYLRLVVLVGGRWYMAASDVQRPVNVHL
jgi:hypothetical protein